MAGRSKNGGRRLLTLKHDKWWFRRAIPKALRKALERGDHWLVNLETGDLKTAQRLRDALEWETKDTFDMLRSGEAVSVAVLSAREQGILHREAIAALTEHQQEDPDDPPGLYEAALWSAEDTAEALSSPVERHALGSGPIDFRVAA